MLSVESGPRKASARSLACAAGSYERTFVIVVLLVHVGLVWHLTRRNFVTIDESGHIPAGVHHWRHGTFELYRVNPPLPRMIATLPVWLADPNTDYGKIDDAPGRRLEWSINNRFAQNNKERYVELVRLARLAGIGWSLLGAWLVMRWSSELFGKRAGLMALVLWCFGPNVLAYAALVTPDLPCTVAGLAACYAFRRYLHRPDWTAAWFAGLLLGVALLTKTTWFLLFLLWPMMALVYFSKLARRASEGGADPSLARRANIASRRFVLRATQLISIGGLAVVVLNLGYGFQGSGRALGDYRFVSRAFAGERAAGQTFGNRFAGTTLADVPVPLPADCVLGLDMQRADFEANWPFYINGQWERGGKWWFYLYALLLKIPLGCWGLFVLAIVLRLTRRASAPWREEMFLLLPALAILVAVSSQTGLNYFRYILPMLPFALIGISRCATFRGAKGDIVSRGAKGDIVSFRSAKGFFACLCGVLVSATVASSLRAYPHSLAYFNEAAGGPENGHRYLVDSNLDWGQDLLELKRWLDDHPEHPPLRLAYFHFIDANVIGIDYELPPATPQPGLYAVSVHFMQGGSFFAYDGRGNRRIIPLGRYSYFQQFQPIAKAGTTIWIFEIR